MSKVRIGWRQQRRIKTSLELQQDQQDCGVAALAAVLRYYGCVVDKELLRRQCGINEVGTTLFGLYQAAEQQGLHVEGVQMGMQELLQLEQLAILHVLLSTGQGHYLVYYGQDKKNKLVLFDPSIGLLRLSVLELDKLWKHKAALLFEVGANVVLAHTHQKAQKRLLYSFLEKDSPYLVISCFLGIGLALLNLSTAVFSHKLIDDLLPALALQRIHLLLVLLTLLLFIHVLLNYIRSFFVLQQSKRFNERITLYFFEKLLHLPKLFFDHRKVGDMIARLTDTQRIQKNVNFIANSTCIDLLVVIMSLVFLIFYSWPIALMITTAMPMYIYIVAIFSKKVVAGQARVMVSYSHTESNYMDCIKGIVFIIERGLENLFLQRTAHYFSDFQAKAYALGMTTARYALCVDLCNVILTITLITMGAHFVIHGSLSIGQLMAILTVSATIFPAFQRLAQLNLYIQEIKVSLNRMYDLVTAHRGAGIAQAGASRTLDRGFENLVLKNIGFGFQAEEVLFQDLNFELRRGEMFVLFGNSGHGKSTLLQLLLGHYMPLEGTISVNGLPLSSIAMPAYRAMIASVAQEITLFNDSLYFNVTMNTQQDEANVSMFQSFWVGHGFHVYFSQLPAGYASLLGEEGYKLSGGQKQLLALARALYSKPTLLLLDEPTAAMDEKMEQFVVGLLIKLKPRMGILFITHRQYIGLYADRCYLLRAGELHEVQAPRPQ